MDEQEIQKLRDKCLDRTFAMLYALELAQMDHVPSYKTINKWRTMLGWHELLDEALDNLQD